MQPIDFRNTTFEQLQDRLSGLRQTVLSAWRLHGPCTTEELAERSGISILTLRPRTTELVQMGFVTLDDDHGREKKGGVYRARTSPEVIRWLNQHQREAEAGAQMSLL